MLNLIDGIRFNNSTFRSGPNQYLAFVEPTQAQRVEALLGPTGSQYGSDSLGGTIQVLTQDAALRRSRQAARRTATSLWAARRPISPATAARRLSIANDKLFWLAGASGRRHNDLRAGQRRRFAQRLPPPLRHAPRRCPRPARQPPAGHRLPPVRRRRRSSPRAPGRTNCSRSTYQRGVQDGVRGYKDLLGGLGRVLSTFDPQVLNWFYGRYEKIGLGFLDSLSRHLLGQLPDRRRLAARTCAITDPITRDYSSRQLLRLHRAGHHAPGHATAGLLRRRHLRRTNPVRARPCGNPSPAP